MQEFSFQCDTSILKNNLKFVLDLIHTFTLEKPFQIYQATDESFERAKDQKREILCPELDASENNESLLSNETLMLKVRAQK